MLIKKRAAPILLIQAAPVSVEGGGRVEHPRHLFQCFANKLAKPCIDRLAPFCAIFPLG